MTIQSIRIPYSHRETSSDGAWIVRFDPDRFEGRPVAFASPMNTVGMDVGAGPTIKEITDSYVKIMDFNAGPDYTLDVLLVDEHADEIQGLPCIVESLCKPHPGPFDTLGYSPDRAASLLTSYVKNTNTTAGIEMVTGYQASFKISEIGAVETSSRNSGMFTNLNTLSVIKGIGTNADGLISAEAGVAPKAGQRLDVQFTQQFDKAPIVLVTPLNRTKPELTQWETVTGVSKSGFSLVSPNMGPDHFISWLAVASDAEPVLPKIKPAHLDAAFEHFFEHFPQHTASLIKHRSTLENMILAGGDPTLELQNEPFANRPMLPKNTKRSISVRNLTIASICIDVAGILTSAMSLGVGAYLQNAKTKLAQAVADEFLEGDVVADETSSLIKSVKDMAEADVSKARKLAWGALLVSGKMLVAGVIKTILVGLAETLELWQWFLAGLKFIAQVAAIVAAGILSGGAAIGPEAALWVARIASVLSGLLSAESLREDITKFVNLPPEPAAPPTG